MPILEGLGHEARANMSRGGQGSTVVSTLDSRAEAARIANVSQGLLAQARRVTMRGNPALVEAVRTGKVKLGTADALLDFRDDELEAVVAEGPEAMNRRAAELRRSNRPRAGGDEDGTMSAPPMAGADGVDAHSTRDAEIGQAAGPDSRGSSVKPGEGERDEDIVAPDAPGADAPGQGDLGADPSGAGPARAEVASARRDAPDEGGAADSPPDPGLPWPLPEWGDKALAEKPQLDPDGLFTAGEWIKLWKTRRRLGFRCLREFDKWVRIYGRVRPAIELLCQEVRLNRNDIETIENFGNADHPDTSPASVLGPAASLLPPWRWPLCKRCDGQGYRRDAASGDGPRPEPCERCSGRGFQARYTPRELATWSSRNRAWARVTGSQERSASGHGADSEAASPRPEGSAPRPR